MAKVKTKRVGTEFNEENIDWSKYSKIKVRDSHIHYYNFPYKTGLSPESYIDYMAVNLSKAMEEGLKEVKKRFGTGCEVTVSGSPGYLTFNISCMETDEQFSSRIRAKIMVDQRSKAYRTRLLEEKTAREIAELKKLAEKYQYEIIPKSDGVYIGGSTIAILSGEAHAT